MTMRLYDTAQRTVVPFAPGPVVRMYVCGITPYDATHLGHAFTFLTYDLLIRRLEDLGHEVRMVRNITDVDDSILPKARQLGVDYLELAASEVARFHADLAALDARPAVAEPRATESIDGIVELVRQLCDRGFAYTAEGTTYFDVSTFEAFGKLSHEDEATMIAHARERGGNPDDPCKRNPLDFVLWQPSASDEPTWASPFGAGRPGWHIECSAMAMAAHGPTLDLHGGGTDLVFPHHESEIAQSEALTGQPLARHWMHVAMVRYQGEKMSKSLGNLVFVSELLKQHDPRAIRLALLPHHYRVPFEWQDDEILVGEEALDRLHRAASAPSGPDPSPYLGRVRAALDDDLDTATALEVLLELADAVADGGDHPGSADGLVAAARLCGVDPVPPLEAR
jgi:L-cysteine:1D-myo-inositol 2-amino-2-deoxy-alpha-D-glucopyranoside ligase